MNGQDPRRSSGAFSPAIRALLVAIAVVLVVHPLWMLRHLGGDHVTTMVDDLVPVGAATVAVLLTARRAWLETRRAARLGWLLLSVSCAGLDAGQATYAVYELLLGVPTPFPGLADVGYVVGTGTGIPAVLLLGVRPVASSRLRVLLDGGIVAAAVLMVSWLSVLEPVWTAGATNTFTFVLGLYYPVGDVVTVVIVLSTIASPGRVNLSLVAVGAGLLCFAFSDSTYAYLTAVNEYQGSNPIDVGWVVGYLTIALASLVGARQRMPGREDQPARWQLALPYVPLAAAVVVAFIHFAGPVSVDPMSTILISLLIVLVLARQFVTVVESRSLAARLTTTAAEREILIEQAPVGICRLDQSGRLLAVNRTFRAMLGHRWDDIAGQSLLSLVHPNDRERVGRAYAALESGDRDNMELECRVLRGDGSSLWASQLAAVVRDSTGQPESFITIVENVTERRWQAERAAHIQRQLLPKARPDIAGYELAGSCLPALEVAGDFYDWKVTEGGCVDLTVADVMGKGLGAGLVMATLRAVLRASPADVGPAARVAMAAESMVGTDTGLFVTMFHARLDPAAGVLRYVDAGHGYCAIRRSSGELVQLGQHSLPLGVVEGEAFAEAAVTIEPGDTLFVYSDGLVERDDGPLHLADLIEGMDDSESASDLTARLLDLGRGQIDDDVTVMVLRRRPAPIAAQRARSQRLYSSPPP